MNLKQCMLTKNDCYKANANLQDSRYAIFRERGPLGVMVHSTGANNPNLRRYVQPDDGILGYNANGNSWNRSGVEACVHAFIGLDKNGKVATYQTLPWNYRGWHCGRDANNTHVAFEICEDDLMDRTYFEAVYKEAVDLTAHICELFDLDPMDDGVVISHAEGAKLGIASNHSDVGHWWSRYGVTMDDFRRDVYDAMEEDNAPLYRVRRSWADKESQIGAYTNLENAKAACPVGYSVYNPDGVAVYTKSEEEIDMSKDEVQKMIEDAVEKAVPAQKEPVVYQTLDKVPEYGKPTVSKLVASGALRGTEHGLGLSTDMLRTLVILDRLGKLD